MIWNIPNFPANTAMTDADLETFGLRVCGDNILWEGRTYEPRFHHVFLENGENSRNFPICVSLYKLNGHWYFEPRLKVVTLASEEELTVWHFPFRGEPMEGVVYRATRDETAFDEDPQDFILDDYGSYVNIIGLRHYCERLHIPASIGGLPVRKVYIRGDYRTENIRYLSADEGAELLYFDFKRCKALSRIELPPTLKLMAPPEGIRQTPWYQNQTGEVYLQDWYCGFQGDHPQTLTIRDGTTGILSGADARKEFRSIELPESLCYLGDAAFGHCTVEAFPLPESCWTWGERILTHPVIAVMPAFPEPPAGPPEAPVINCPRDLYELGKRYCPDGFFPLAPRLSYNDVNGWQAEFWSCSENGKTVANYAKLRLKDGRPLKIRTFEPHTLNHTLWTENYTPPFYWISEEYLSECLKLMAGGEPTKHQLAELEEAWHRCNPDSFNAWLSWKRQYEQDKKDPYPIVPTKEILSFWSWDRVKTALGKEKNHA